MSVLRPIDDPCPSKLTHTTSKHHQKQTGAELYPIGGAILSKQLELAVTGGVGGLTGARGQVQITYDPAAQVFKYAFALL